MKDFLLRQGIWFENYVYQHKYNYNPHNTAISDANRRIGTTPSQPSNIAIIHEESPIEAAEATELLVQSITTNETPIDTLLQPTFLVGTKVARADVAVRLKTESGEIAWEILEIKSSTEKSFRKKVPDLAYTVSLARLAGYRVHKASLILVNPNFARRDMSIEPETTHEDENLLYKTIDCTELVDEYIMENEMDKEADTIDDITSGDTPPLEFKLACGKCELLGVECGPLSTTSSPTSEESTPPSNEILPLHHGIWELPRLSQKQFPEVLERGLPTLELKDLNLEPDESSLVILTKNQLKYFHAVKSNTVVVDRIKLKKQLQAIANSGNCTMYLDFEAVSVLNPPYPGMTPYEAMITQYSLHKVEKNSSDPALSHFEYLSDPQQDCRKVLLEQLLRDLGYDMDSPKSKNVIGPILVYSSYEKTQLKKLSALFPEYSNCIADIIDSRLVDLEKIIKDCVSHPEFCGRSSIKVTLPALVPGFEKAYHDLSKSDCGGIADGGTASAAFADLISGVRSETEEVNQTRKALLAYCKLDTLALVEIHKALWKLIEEAKGP